MQATSREVARRFAKRGQLHAARAHRAAARPRRAVPRDLMPLAGYRMHDDKDGIERPGGGIDRRHRLCRGVRCMVIGAATPRIKGGTVAPMGLRKGLRVQQIVLREQAARRAPGRDRAAPTCCYQAEIFVDGGRGFANLARMSARGIPQITVVHGSSTAGGAYMPGLSDYVIMVRDQRQGLPGRPAAAEGRDRRDRHRRGAGRRRDARRRSRASPSTWPRTTPTRSRIAREVIAKWHWNDALPPRAARPSKEPLLRHRRAAAASCRVDYREPYDVREVIARLVDGSRLPRVQGASTASRRLRPGRDRGRAGRHHRQQRPDRRRTARSRPRSSSSSADQAGTPIVYLQNTTGYMVGTRRRARRHRQARLAR